MLAAQSHVLDDVLNEKNVDVSQFGVKSCERGELALTMGRPCVCLHFCVKHRPLNKIHQLYGATNYGQPLRVMELKADGHQHSGSPLTSKPRDEY